MFALEDYMDDLGLLPQEISNGLEAMKELDLIVKNSMDQTKQSIDMLFSNADTIKDDEFHYRFKQIMKNSEISIKKSDKKINLASNMQGFLKKYVNRLDNEINKFKIDFEDDNITGQTEKRVLNSKQGNITNQKENKFKAKKHNCIGK